MLKDSEVRNLVYSSDLIDRTFFDETKHQPTEALKPLKHAQKIYFRSHGRQWKLITYKNLLKYFKDKKIISSGVVAVGHRSRKNTYTQYCNSLIVKSKKYRIYEVDLDAYVYWKKDFHPKK